MTSSKQLINNTIIYSIFLLGPFVLKVFNTLLKHLRVSVENEKNLTSEQSTNDEKEFQDVIIDTIGGLFKN